MKNTSDLPRSVFDFNYTKEEHLINLMYMSMLQENTREAITAHSQKTITNKEFINTTISLYYLIETYIETGIKDIVTTISKVIINCYLFLISYFANQTIDSINKKSINIYDKKNWDYGNAQEIQFKWDDVISLKVILEHKIMRIKRFFDGVKFTVKDEKISDTILDLINYCYIYLIWAAKGFPKERTMSLSYQMM